MDAGEGVHGTEAGQRIVSLRWSAPRPSTETARASRSVLDLASRRAVDRDGLSRTETVRPAAHRSRRAATVRLLSPSRLAADRVTFSVARALPLLGHASRTFRPRAPNARTEDGTASLASRGGRPDDHPHGRGPGRPVRVGDRDLGVVRARRRVRVRRGAAAGHAAVAELPHVEQALALRIAGRGREPHGHRRRPAPRVGSRLHGGRLVAGRVADRDRDRRARAQAALVGHRHARGVRAARRVQRASSAGPCRSRRRRSPTRR